MKVYCIPLDVPNPDTDPQGAETARKFIASRPGVVAFCPYEGKMLICFDTIENARSTAWKLEEFTPEGKIKIIVGVKVGDALNLTKVVDT